MPYTATTWVNGTTALNATHLQNLESQYTESSLSFEPDQFTAGFVITGYAASGSVGTTTVTVAAGTAYLLQTDGTTRQRKLTSSTQTTSTPSTTYHLYLQPDGTWFWSTAGSGQAANSLHVADVATNGSGQISTITDFRPLNPILFPSLSSYLELPVGFSFGALSSVASTPSGQGMLWVSGNNAGLASPLSGSAGGIFFAGWNGSSRVIPFSINGQFGSAPTWIDGDGSLEVGSSKFKVNASGVVTELGNQATAGSFGVPVVLGIAANTHVTATTAQTILSVSVPANGMYRVSLSAVVNGSGSPSITANVNWNEPNLGGSPHNRFIASVNPAGTQVLLAAAAIAAGSQLNCAPQVMYAGTGATIDVIYQNSAATPSDWVSAYIERLS